MKTSLPILACCLLAFPILTLSLGTQVYGDDAKPMMPSAMDKKFIMKAAGGNMFEVEMGKLAADKASSQDVKDFGSKMVHDHGMANDELKGIASAQNVDVPTGLNPMHQKMYDDLNAMSGKSFDEAYLKDMSKAHKMDDALYMKEGDGTDDTALKNYAMKTDKVIKMHISMLNDVMAKMASNK